MAKPDYAYGCLMLDLVVPGWDALLAQLPDADLYEPGSRKFGRQAQPHCTVLFGFHHRPGLGQELLDRLPVDRPALSGAGVVATGCGVFENPQFDVLKLNLQSPELDRLNRWCRARYAYTSEHPDYLPHATLAYLQPGRGAAYQTPNRWRLPLQPVSWTYSVPGDGQQKLVRPV